MPSMAQNGSKENNEMSIETDILALPTQTLDIDYQLDDGPARHTIGLVVLDTDHATERGFRSMSPSDDVQFFVSRVKNVSPVTVENLRLMSPQLSQSTSLILPGTRIDSIAYSCTSGTVAIGFDEVRASLQSAHAGVPCSTPITAALAGFERLGIKRIAFLTPYIDAVNQPMRRYIEDRGVEVLSIHSFNLEDDVEMGRVPPTAIREAAVMVDRPDVDAIFISCTALRATEVIDTVERELNKPVLTSIQVLFWDALRLAKYDRPIEGFGHLLKTWGGIHA